VKARNILGVHFGLLSYGAVLLMVARWGDHREQHGVTLQCPHVPP